LVNRGKKKTGVGSTLGITAGFMGGGAKKKKNRIMGSL